MSCTILNDAMIYLSQGGYTERLLQEKLETQFINEPNHQLRIKQTMDYLKSIGLINDERYAKNLALRYSHKGDKAIINYLQQNGVEVSSIKKTLHSLEPEFQRALKEVLALQANWQDNSLQEQQFQIMRLLSSRSFSYQTLNQVINILMNREQSLKTQCLANSIKVAVMD